jgi:hypothetical protein
VFNLFGTTGDWIRSSSSNLELVINAGVRTVIYDGDADYICNYMGVEAMVRASSCPPSSSLCAYFVTACAGCLLGHGVLAAVRAAELLDLQRQRQACGSVQECGHVLISTSFRGWSFCSRVPVAGRAPGRGGAANVHANHVRQVAVKHVMYEPFRELGCM